jgi:hypothetical protein
VGCEWVFLGGVGGGEEKLQDTYCSLFFAGRREVPNSPFYVIYYILNSGGFAVASSDHREGTPDPRYPGQTRTLFKFRQPD